MKNPIGIRGEVASLVSALLLAAAMLLVAGGAAAAEAEAQTADDPKSEHTDPEADNPEDDAAESGPESGAFMPGKGFRVALTDYGELRISGYIVLRWIDQLPAKQSFTDHLGQVRPIDTRNDIQLHREMLYFSGWIYSDRLRYQGMIWTVNATTQVAVAGYLNYFFTDAFSLFGGIGSLPGTRSVTYVFPYFFGTDRQMADEFFRPSFTGGIWAVGEPLKGLKYHAMLGNNLSGLGITAAQLTRTLATSGAVWWMPTTGEFGPRGAFGDYELHQRLATRFGVNFTRSHENRFTQPSITSPDNTQIRLSDSLLLFETGSLAPGVTVTDALYQMAAASAAAKYEGLALNFEYYWRWLTELKADGPIPVDSIFDQGFYVQAGYQLLPQRLELFGATSWVLGQFNDSHEYALGFNVYPAATRNWRINGIAIYVHESAMGNLFGYYVGGQTGPILSLATDVFF